MNIQTKQISLSLLILAGDGIGPEVMAEVKKIIDWFGEARGLRFDVRRSPSLPEPVRQRLERRGIGRVAAAREAGEIHGRTRVVAGDHHHPR